MPGISCSEGSTTPGTWEYDTPQSVAPEGWIVFDPYTGCTYCLKCCAEIEGAKSARLESDAGEAGKGNA